MQFYILEKSFQVIYTTYEMKNIKKKKKEKKKIKKSKSCAEIN